MKALRTAANRIYDRYWDARLGIDTTGADYGPTPYRLVRHVFGQIGLGPQDQLIDFGSGRGRVVCYAAQYPIARVAGVEIGGEAVAKARDNIAHLRHREARDVSVAHGSATDFDCADGTVYYFANPFEESLFSKVLANIRASLEAKPREARIVYYNPMRRAVLDELDWLRPSEVLHRSLSGAPAVLLYRTR